MTSSGANPTPPPAAVGVREVTVSGSRRAMGRQHGAACADLIRRVRDARLAIVARATGMPRDAALTAGLRYLAPVEARFPHLIEELRGIAEGAEVPFEEAFFIQVASELGFRTEGCSILAIRSDGRWFVAQNWDTPRDVFGLQIVLRVRPDDAPEAVMFTYAGVVGYTGMNRHGVCHVASQLLSPDWRVGVTHYFVKRRFLELDSVGTCLDLVRTTPISSSGAYVLGDPHQAAAVEWLPSGFAVVLGEHLAHTNHIEDRSLAPLERYLDALPDSPTRLARLRRLLSAAGDAGGDVNSGGAVGADGGLEVIRRILTDHDGHPSSICRHGGAGDLHTMASVIYEPAKAVMHLACGNPCTTPYRTFAL